MNLKVSYKELLFVFLKRSQALDGEDRFKIHSIIISHNWMVTAKYDIINPHLDIKLKIMDYEKRKRKS